MRFPRIPHLAAAVALLALAAPAANAMPQDMRSPDARDIGTAVHAKALQDLAHRGGGSRIHTSSPAGTTDRTIDAARAQERYYSSYGPLEPSQPARPAAPDDGAPWLTLALGLGLTVVLASAVTVAVRARRRTTRVHVAA